MANQFQAVSEKQRQPRWPALIALLGVGGLYAALPEHLILGPRYFLGVLVSILAAASVWTYQQERHDWNQILGYFVIGIETCALIGSVTLLLSTLPTHRTTPTELLRAAGALWITNVLVFALWYWRLDAGGPHQRDASPHHCTGAFLFPQMTIAPGEPGHEPDWSPHFVDYLFFAFNSSTALSPTDAPVLSRWAKVLMMIQATISLTILVVLAARAVNIL